MKAFKATILLLLSISALGLSSSFARQPHMERALENLRAARAELQAAEHNKGGWRIRALENVDRAIRETEKGMAVAR